MAAAKNNTASKPKSNGTSSACQPAPNSNREPSQPCEAAQPSPPAPPSSPVHSKPDTRLWDSLVAVSIQCLEELERDEARAQGREVVDAFRDKNQTIDAGTLYLIEWDARELVGPATLYLLSGNDPVTLHVLSTIASVDVNDAEYRWAWLPDRIVRRGRVIATPPGDHNNSANSETPIAASGDR
ncbi:hypothetical protein CHU98_g5903 [Xylaria longipes]|nr:hypothetical protein CHU98_g5903 [Xylaria longipes]